MVRELVEALTDFVEWAEQHREQAKRAGERPCIDAHRVARARRLLKRFAAEPKRGPGVALRPASSYIDE